MGIVATLGGQPISGAFEWRIVTGTKPYTTALLFNAKQREALDAMVGTDKPLGITNQESGASVTIQGVHVLREVTTKAPFHIAYLVADRRWKWERTLVVRDYNMTRKTGDRALVGPNAENVPVELAQSIDTFRYYRWSLKNESERWTVRTMLEDTLEAVDPGAWRVDSTSIEGDGEQGALSIQNLSVRDGGDEAVGRALGFAPGTNVYVDEDSVVRVIDATDLAAADAIKRSHGGPAAVSGDYARRISRRALRPKSVRVYFVREVEMRFDFNEQGSYATVGRGQIYMENVAPVPDPVLTLVGGRRVSQGTYVPIVDLLAAWEADTANAEAGTKLASYSIETVRLHWHTGQLGAVWGAQGADRSETGNAAARAATIYAHWRQTFRVAPQYAERIRQFQAIRVSVLDKVTGTRSPAMAWSQYTVIPSIKAMAMVGQRNPSLQFAALNRDDYPGADTDVTDKPASPAVVSVVDSQLGIFRVSYSQGPYGFVDATVPGMLCSDTTGTVVVPTRNVTEYKLRPIAWGGKVGSTAPRAAAAPDFAIAIIVSGVAAAPNNIRQLHRRTVKPGDLDAVLRSKFASGEANGPDFDVFVAPATCTARYGWQSTSAAKASISTLLGFNSTDPTKAGFDPDTREIPGFLSVNGQDEIPAVAAAVAAEVYAQFVDGTEGVHQTHMAGRVPIAGNIASVAYSVGADGRNLTSVEFSPQRATMSRFAFLPSEVRQMTLRILPGA